eukprot:g6133.t1
MPLWNRSYGDVAKCVVFNPRRMASREHQIEAFAPYAFDAAYTIAYALHDLIETKGEDDWTGERLRDAMLAVDFQGVTGRVRFYGIGNNQKHMGDRRQARYGVQRHNGTRWEKLASVVVDGRRGQYEATAGAVAGNRFFIDQTELEVHSEKLGAGGSGQVFGGRWNGEDVAVKQLTVHEGDLQGVVQEVKGEAQLLLKCGHPNIVRLFGISAREMADGSGSVALLMVMERCAVSLDQVIRINGLATAKSEAAPSSERGKLQPGQRRWIMSPESCEAILVQVCFAMRYLHRRGIVHRDLKPGNVLLDERNQVKVADFGASREGMVGAARATNGATMTSNVGTPVYMAPELYTAGRLARYSGAVDVYSFALLAWALFVGARPFDKELEQSESVFRLIQRVHDGLRPEIRDGDRITPFFRELLPRCWHRDPEQRPSGDSGWPGGSVGGAGNVCPGAAGKVFMIPMPDVVNVVIKVDGGSVVLPIKASASTKPWEAYTKDAPRAVQIRMDHHKEDEKKLSTFHHPLDTGFAITYNSLQGST